MHALILKSCTVTTTSIMMYSCFFSKNISDDLFSCDNLRANNLHLGNLFSGPNPFMRYVGFAELAANAWSATALESILRIVAVAPEQFSSYYSPKMDWIRVSCIQYR